MKILFVYHSMMVAFDAYIRSVTRPLAARGHEVHVLRCGLKGRSSDEVREGVWIHRRPQAMRLRGAQIVSHIPVVHEILRILGGPDSPALSSPFLRLSVPCSNYLAYRGLGIDFDVIETPEHLAEGLVFAILRERPLVIQVHGPLGVVAPHMGYRLGLHLKLADSLERQATKMASAIVAPSQFALNQLAEAGWPGTHMARVIPHAIDVDFWSDVPRTDEAGPVVLAVGEVGRLKGSDVLVRAAAKLGQRVPGVRVIFVGPSARGPDGVSSREAIARLAESHGVECQFTGFMPRDSLGYWYGTARVVAVPSRFDTFSQVGLEAMACGRPVVCSAHTGLSELAGEADGALTVVPSEDVDSLVDALEPLLLDPALAADRGRAARSFVERHSRPEEVARRREAVYALATERWGATVTGRS